MLDKNWIPIIGYEGLYEINPNGKVRSLHKRNYQKELTPKLDRAGYLSFTLCKNGTPRTKLGHRLVAEAFILNPENKAEVNHMNGIRTDNSVENLEWVTHSENMQHAYRTRLAKSSAKKCKKIMDARTGKLFDSIRIAADFFNLNYNSVRNMLSGVNRNTTCLQYV